MKHTSKQSGRSRNKALAQRAAKLGCGISLIAVSAMLAARPARASDPVGPASVTLAGVPANGSAAGFVTAKSHQLNAGAAVAASLNEAFGSSEVDNNGVESVPSTASVTGNELAAFATGSGTTNTVDLANIGTGDVFTGISVLDDQQNTFTSSPVYVDDDILEGYDYTPTTINSSVTDSGVANETTNPVDGDSLTNSSNLIEAQTTGNVADSSVNGVVPLNYDSPEPGSVTLASGAGTASGNVVVGSSQTNVAIDGGNGSLAKLDGDTISLNAYTASEDPQSVSLSTAESDNAISSVFLGNSVDNDIGVDLTSGINTGGPAFAGALVVASQQANYRGGYGFEPNNDTNFNGNFAYNNHSQIVTNIAGTLDGSATLADGAVEEDGNVISAAATGNSALGATGGPGNEISLGVNLAGITELANGNTINAEGTIISGGDLVLGNQQLQGGSRIAAYTYHPGIYANVQNLAGSSINLSNNAITASAMANNASNAIETPAGAGINLISGLAALTSDQSDSAGAYARTSYGGVEAYAGDSSGTLSLTNSSVNLTSDKETTTADGNQVTNNISLSASTIDAGALGAPFGPASVFGSLPGENVVFAGISLNNLQFSPAPAEATQYSAGPGAYLQGDTISNTSAVVSNSLLTAEATGNNATNSVAANGSQGVSGAIGLLNSQVQFGGVNANVEEGDDDNYGNEAIIALQSLGGAQGISGSSALLGGTEIYAEATDNNASNTLDATGGTLSNAAGPDGIIGLRAELATANDVSAGAISDLALVNEQDDLGLPAYADNYGSQAFITADSTDGTISGSSFTVSGPANSAPTSQALAIGNEALNALSALASTMLTDTAGLVNAQANSTGAEALLQDNFVGVDLNPQYPETGDFGYGEDGGDISDTSITVGTGATGGSNPNILRALAYGNQASNVLSASAGTVNPDATAGSFSVDGSYIGDSAPYDTGFFDETFYGVGAAYGLLNDQTAAGTIAAAGEDVYLGIDIGNASTNPALTGVTASTAGNAVVASAFGNQASNSATVAADNLDAEEYYPVADVTNLQTNDGTLSASLSVVAGYPMLTTDVFGDGEVLDSTLGVSDNTVLTQAEGNNATNSLDTTGGNIADVAAEALGEVYGSTFEDSTSQDPLAFSVQNVQHQGSPITVNQTGTGALVATGGAVSGSTLTADTNAFEATGYGNNATSSLDFGGTSNPVNLLDTSAGLQSTQYTSGDVNVTLGSPGTAAVAGDPEVDVPDVPYTVESNGPDQNEAKVINTNTLDVIGQSLVFDLASLNDAQRTAFEDALPNGVLVGNYYTLTPGYHVIDNLDVLNGPALVPDSNYLYNTNGSAVTGQEVDEFTIAATNGTPAVPPSPSVLIRVAGDITDSTLDVSNNTFNATAVSNNAVNTQNIAATTVNGGADVSGDRGGEVDEDDSYGNTDYALVNNQSTANVTTATAYGEAGINPDNTSAINGSSLNVSDNTNLAKAEAELASNTLTLSATNAGSGGTAPTLSLVNNQSSDGNVIATAGTFGVGEGYGLEVTAPGAITNSTLTMDDNSSEALAVENNATNLLSADATNLGDATDGGNASAIGDVYSDSDNYALTKADYSVTNAQSVYDDTVTASDVTYMFNSDASSFFFDLGSGSATTSGLNDSSVSISGNTTSAFAQANGASNTLDLTAANSAATGAVSNVQSSGATVDAYGADFTGFSLNGGTDDGPAAATGSSISLTNNSTQVQGIGNQATNALNADTGATYGPQNQASIGTDDGVTTAAATYAVLNNQTNTGPVAAEGGAYYVSALNGGEALTTPVTNTTVTVSYDTVDIKAFGNSANNSATVSALNSGNATVALANVQTNTGAITATGNGSLIGSSIGGPGASNTTVEVGNNSVVASAIGNVATNAIASH